MVPRHYKRLQAFMASSAMAIGLGLMAQPGFAQLPPNNAPKAPAGNVRGKPASKPRGGLRIGGAPAGQIRDQVEKKNAVDRPNLNTQRDTQYFRVAVSRPDGSFLSLNYYPALPGENPPVILLVHEKDRSSRDFADKIEEFKDPNGLAAELQGDGFAVVTLDVAGLSDPRKRNANLTKDEPAPKARPADNQATGNSVEQAVRDLRLTYQFLVDRHNRLEFNLGKLTILNIGEGANASLEWLREATQPTPAMPHRGNIRHDPRQKHIGGQIASGGMNSATDRPSDVSAIILISPVESWQSVKTAPTLKSLLDGSPINVLAIGGSTDKASADTLKALKPIVERRESRLSKVETMETGLHGARFLRFEPGLVPKINRFLEQTVEYQKTEWEPRYNLTPISYKLLEAVSKTAAQAESRTAGVEKSAEKSKDTPKPAAPPEPKPESKPKAEPTKPAEPAKPATVPAEPPKTESPKN